jgi:hypothetical protein
MTAASLSEPNSESGVEDARGAGVLWAVRCGSASTCLRGARRRCRLCAGRPDGARSWAGPGLQNLDEVADADLAPAIRLSRRRRVGSASAAKSAGRSNGFGAVRAIHSNIRLDRYVLRRQYIRLSRCEGASRHVDTNGNSGKYGAIARGVQSAGAAACCDPAMRCCDPITTNLYGDGREGHCCRRRHSWLRWAAAIRRR